MKRRNYFFFKSHAGFIAFLILLAGTLIIQSALWFTYSQYATNTRASNQPHDIAKEVIKLTGIAKTFSSEDAKTINDNLKYLHSRTILASIQTSASKNSEIIPFYLPNQLEKYIENNTENLNISLPLDTNKWLVIKNNPHNHTTQRFGYFTIFISLLIALLLLDMWMINYLSIPLISFANASKRFGVDLNAPAIPLQGTAETQEVITAFNQMQARIRRLVENRTQMLAAISHDLRTPITRLQLRAEFLQDSDQYEKAIADLKEMETMISSILSFARNYSADEPTELFDLKALIETLCDNLVDTGNQVQFTSTLSRLPIEARMLSLKRAINNIVENAVKYGKEAQVNLQEKNKEATILIVDQGPGIPEHAINKVFEPFFRIDAARSPHTIGTGLGMAVARDIIQAHGGNIELANNKTTGLTVTITLPLK